MKPATTTLTDRHWNAICQRDSNADSRFLYGVISTGIFCRPSCPSRRPRQENVRIFNDAKAAMEAGFRPCQRCRPVSAFSSAVTETVIELCRYIEQSPSIPNLATLSHHCGWSRHHLQRQFKSVTGLSPRDYGLAVRRRRLEVQLHPTARVTDAMYAAGVTSSSQRYSRGKSILGMPPGQFRSAGRGTTIRVALAQCSLGSLLVAESDQGICAISLGDDPEGLLAEFQSRFSGADVEGPDSNLNDRVSQVVALIEQPHQCHALPLDIRGTAFQQRVWKALQAVPPGSTLSYQALADAIGQPGAARAVASACAANRLAVAVPCHRIVRRDGGLSGYRWGVDRKRELLEREAKSCADTEQQ